MIYALKLTITNFCGYNCKYCYVNTNNNDVLDYNLWKKYINYYLSQIWNEKVIFFLWWEALLEFNLLKELVLFARKEAISKNKKLSLFLTTSWLSLTIEKAKFLYENNVKIWVSIDWKKDIHWLNRISKIWKNTFDDTINSINIFNNFYDDTNLGYALTVDENTLLSLFKSFLYLSNLDIVHRSITIAGVYKKWWSKNNLEILKNEIIKICNFIDKNIIKNKFYYYNVLDFFILELQKWKEHRNWNVEIHVFPNWESSLKLFKQTKLGNTDFDPTDFRFDYVLKMAKNIITKSKKNISYKEYIDSLNNKAIL